MRTANPALNDNVFSQSRSLAKGDTMTIGGTVNKTFVLLLLAIGTAAWTWGQVMPASTTWGEPIVPQNLWLLWVGSIGGLIFAIITIFKKTWAPVTAPMYAALEGLALGGISALMEAQYPGIVFQAVLGTFGTLFALLTAYRTGIIRATENFKLGVVAATGGIFLVYMLSWILGMFGVGVPYIHEGGVIGIGFSVFVVIVAALNLVLDFDFIENGEKVGAPRFMEWYAAFGLMVTLVWLYLEILRLLAKTRNR